jgi:glutaredoxin 3
MARIEIYTTFLCGFCHAAKRLLAEKGAEFEEIDVTMDPQARTAMAARAGGRTTVPQIFIDGRHVGGCEELYALDGAGRLDDMLLSPALASET